MKRELVKKIAETGVLVCANCGEEKDVRSGYWHSGITTLLCNKCDRHFEFHFKEGKLVKVNQSINEPDFLEPEAQYVLVSNDWVKEDF